MYPSLAETTKWNSHTLLGQEGCDRSYDIEELDADLATLEVSN